MGEECGGVHVHVHVHVFTAFFLFSCVPHHLLIWCILTGLCPRHADYVRISSTRILCRYICKKYFSYWHCISCHKSYTVPCDLFTMLRLMVCLVPGGGGGGGGGGKDSV